MSEPQTDPQRALVDTAKAFAAMGAAVETALANTMAAVSQFTREITAATERARKQNNHTLWS